MHTNKFVTFVEVDRNNSSRIWPTKDFKAAFLDNALLRCHKNEPLFIKLAHRYKRCDLFVSFYPQQIDNCLPPMQYAPVRESEDFQPITFAPIGIEEDILMG